MSDAMEPTPEPERLLDLDLPAVPESAAVARRAMLEAIQDVAVDRDAAAVMVSEAVANCSLHAYPEGVVGRVRVSAEIAGNVLDVVVSDDGVGMTSQTESSGLGLGVPLMGDLADGVRVEGGSGTRVQARFELFGAAGPHGRDVPSEPFGGRARRRLARLRRR
jgi:anti-sigma regulatory factor (Ser/Thr protein kinase)